MKKCQPRMLTPYLDGELSDDLRNQVEEHLVSCAACGVLLEELMAARGHVQEMGRAAIPLTSLEPALEMFSQRAGLVEAASVPSSEPRQLELSSIPVPGAIGDGAPAPEPLEVEPQPALEMPEEAVPDDAAEFELPRHAEAPPDDVHPPWVSETELNPVALEVEGRRAVDEAITVESERPPPTDEAATAEGEPPPVVEAEPQPWDGAWQAPAPSNPEGMSGQSPPPEQPPPPAGAPEVETVRLEPHPNRPAEELHQAVSRMREELDGGAVTADASTDAASPATQKPIPARLVEFIAAPQNRLKLQVTAAGAILAVTGIVVAVLLRGPAGETAQTIQLPTPTHQPTPGQTSPQARPSAAASPAAPNHGPQAPPLTGIVTAGGGGSGYRVTGIRTAIHPDGVERIVFDLSGSGPTPSVQLGRGSDGNYYLSGGGIVIDPSQVAGFSSGGPITSMSQTSTRGLDLKLTGRSAEYAMTYLLGPTRLVVDFK